MSSFGVPCTSSCPSTFQGLSHIRDMVAEGVRHSMNCRSAFWPEVVGSLEGDLRHRLLGGFTRIGNCVHIERVTLPINGIIVCEDVLLLNEFIVCEDPVWKVAPTLGSVGTPCQRA